MEVGRDRAGHRSVSTRELSQIEVAHPMRLQQPSMPALEIGELRAFAQITQLRRCVEGRLAQ
jgi:hypothetical protein